MNNLKTLLSSDATEFERQLLGAAAGERPSPELQLRMQQALGVGVVVPLGAGASIAAPEISGSHVAVNAAASSWAAGTWLKVVIGVGAAAGLVAGGLALRSSEPAPLPRASTAEPDQLAPAAPVEAPTPNATSPALSPAALSPAALSRELREEIDLLDRVRTALDQRDARAASALLETYSNRFPEGRLAPEASVLRARTARVARTAR